MESLDLERLIDDLGCSLLCCRKDSHLSILYASGAFYQMLGFREGEITALQDEGPAPVLRGGPPVSWKTIEEEIRENGFAEPELRLIKKDGHHIWASYRVRLEQRPDGEEYFCGVVEDITLKRRARRYKLERVRELEALTANLPCGVLCCRNDEFLTLNFVSEGFCRMTGYGRDEILSEFNDCFIRMVHEKDRVLLLRRTVGRRKQDGAAELTYRIKGRDGHPVWVLDKTRLLEDQDGNRWLYSVLMNVTETQRAQEELAVTEERYRLLLEHAADPIVDFNLKTGRIYYSPTFTAHFGTDFPQSGNLVNYLEKNPLIYGQDRRPLIDRIIRMLRGETVGDGEFRLRGTDGGFIWYNLHPTTFFDEQGEATRVIIMISDIDRRKKESIALRQQAEHDLLTGLYNRVTATDRIDRFISLSKKGERHALFVIDIDNFKNVNDQLGHLKGDELIIETASRIKKLFREKDVVARVGGDEFVVLLRRIVSVDLIVKKAENIEEAFRSCGISGSIGVSFYPYDGSSYEELFRKADAAMYAAKNSGKNSFRVYTREIGEVTRETT